MQVTLYDPYLSASEVVFHEEALYQVYLPLCLMSLWGWGQSHTPLSGVMQDVCRLLDAWSYPLKPGRYSCRYLVGVIVSARFVQVRSPPPNCQPTNVVKALKKSLAPVIAKDSFRDMYGAIPDLTWNDLRKIGWRTPNTDSNSCSIVFATMSIFFWSPVGLGC